MSRFWIIARNHQPRDRSRDTIASTDRNEIPSGRCVIPTSQPCALDTKSAVKQGHPGRLVASYGHLQWRMSHWKSRTSQNGQRTLCSETLQATSLRVGCAGGGSLLQHSLCRHQPLQRRDVSLVISRLVDWGLCDKRGVGQSWIIQQSTKRL